MVHRVLILLRLVIPHPVVDMVVWVVTQAEQVGHPADQVVQLPKVLLRKSFTTVTDTVIKVM
jgi:hypothetical protein